MLTPLAFAILVGTFWTGVGTAAVIGHNGDVFDHGPRQDVVISARQSDDHDAACAAKYRSYDVASGQYLSSRDHQWHDCTL